MDYLTIIKSYLKFIDSGNFFKEPVKWLYIAVAVLALLAPLSTLFGLGSLGFVFRSSFWEGIVALLGVLLSWIVLQAGGILVASIWWNRKDDLTSGKDEFITTPILAHLIQTAGESAGTWIGIVGAALSLLGAFSLSTNTAFGEAGLASLVGVIVAPVVGFLVVLVSRFFSEQIKVFAAIANNTKKK